MLNVRKNEDRLDYGEILTPPEGYALTSGLATTYSLDLHTLLAIPVALFYAKALEGDFTLENRFDVLDAIQRTDQVVKIYCQKGKIKVPKEHNRLFAFLEDAAVEVLPPNPFSSFHPKIWILRFEQGENVCYRLLVLSRNLTFDRSWDVALRMDGPVSKQIIQENWPIIAMARYLRELSDFPNSESFLADLWKVEFDGVHSFDAFNFHPIGFEWNHERFPNPLETQTFDQLLVFTPFLDEKTLQHLHKICPGKKWLFSREEELKKIDPAALAPYETYFLNRMIVEGEDYDVLEEEGIEAQKQNLHAKFYIGRRDGKYYWFLGSANASQPAFRRNTEFLIELHSREYKRSPQSIYALLVNEEAKYPFFERFIPKPMSMQETKEDWEHRMRILEHQLIEHPIKGRLTERENQQNYDLSLQIDLTELSWNEQFTIKLAPLNVKYQEEKLFPRQANSLYFENQKLTDLSVFVKIIIVHQNGLSRRLLTKMKIDLPADRKKQIVRKLIDSQDKFFRYLRFILAESPYDQDASILSGTQNRLEDTKGSASSAIAFDVPIFEQLLISASRNPEKLRTIDDLINRLKTEEENESAAVIPKEFLDFWKVFQALIPNNS